MYFLNVCSIAKHLKDCKRWRATAAVWRALSLSGTHQPITWLRMAKFAMHWVGSHHTGWPTCYARRILGNASHFIYIYYRSGCFQCIYLGHFVFHYPDSSLPLEASTTQICFKDSSQPQCTNKNKKYSRWWMCFTTQILNVCYKITNSRKTYTAILSLLSNLNLTCKSRWLYFWDEQLLFHLQNIKETWLVADLLT